MKIAFVNEFDAEDDHAWSGCAYHIRRGLLEAGADLTDIDALRNPWRPFLLAKKAFYRGLLGKNFRNERDPLVLKAYAREVERRLATVPHDIVLSPGTIPLAYSNLEKPEVTYTDATFGGLVDYYHDYSNLARESIQAGMDQDNRVLQRVARAIFSSDWATESAVKHHGVDREKLSIVPFGASITSGWTASQIDRQVDARLHDGKCRILFCGVAWERKGGPVVTETVENLRARGLDCELDIVGAKPPIEPRPHVRVHGFIRRGSTAGKEQLAALFSKAHFLVVPSQAEAFGVVFAEASSFALPSLATRTGGIPAAIHEGVNGHTLPLDSQPGEFADLILRYWNDKPAYRNICATSFRRYEEELNWKETGRRILELLPGIQSRKTKGAPRGISRSIQMPNIGDH